jgi:hypothetical protein
VQPLLVEAVCFALTQAVELALVAVLAPRSERVQLVLTFACANAVTQPSASLVHALFGFVATELAVVAVETVAVYACSGLTLPRAFLLALVVNAVSASLSL